MSGYLLDTSALSLFFNRRATAEFAAWVDARQREGEIFMSVVSVQEIEKGAAKLAAVKGGNSEKAVLIARWIRDLCVEHDHRLLPIDGHVALTAGRMEGSALAAGHKPGLADVLIGATAKAHDLVVVTRNLRDFEALAVPCQAPLD